MKSWHEKSINAIIFEEIMENISPKSYVLCVKCGAVKVDIQEIAKFLMSYCNQNLYDGEDYDSVIAAETMKAILDDILEDEPEDALDHAALRIWRKNNESRLFGRINEECCLQYYLYEEMIFYKTNLCKCFANFIYRVKVE